MSNRKINAAGEQTEQHRSIYEVPMWIAAEGNLYWGGAVVLTSLAAWAYTERLLLDAFESQRWPLCIADPFPRDAVGHDPTQSRRSAIHNLNRHLGDGGSIVFFSAHGDQVCWRRAHGHE